jgi:hypothetical protein
LFTLYAYDHILFGISISLIGLHNMHIFVEYPCKLMSSPFYEVFLSFCFEKAYSKFMTLYNMSTCSDAFFDFVSTILLLECFIKQACKSHFITHFENIWKLRDNMSKSMVYMVYMRLYVKSWLFYAKNLKVCVVSWVHLLLIPTPNKSPEPHLHKVLPCRHPCHTWNLRLETYVKC